MKYLTNRGVKCDLNNIKKSEKKRILNDLEITPSKLGITKKIRLFYKKSNDIYLPKFYRNISNNLLYGELEDKRDPQTKNIKFVGILSKDQEIFAEKSIEQLNNKGGGYLSLPCGFGKCFHENTKISVENKGLIPISEVELGDKLFGYNLKPTYITSVSVGTGEEFVDISFPYLDDVKTLTVTYKHIMTLYDTKHQTVVDKELDDDLITKINKREYLSVFLKKYSVINAKKRINSEKDTYYGFSLSDDKRFVLRDDLIAHNTVIALNIVSKLKLKTLVIVNRISLLEQWKEKCKIFTNINPGVIQGKTQTKLNGPIVIASAATLVRRNDPYFINKIGLVIYDEFHNLMTPIFSDILKSTCTKYSLGLTATPSRSDLTFIFLELFIGKCICKELSKEISNKVCKTNVFILQMKRPKELQMKRIFLKSNVTHKLVAVPDSISMIIDLCKDVNRNKIIIDILLKNQDRYWLVLSHIVFHVKLLKRMFDRSKKSNTSSGLLIGESTVEERRYVMENSRFIFATYSISSEGIDIERLNSLFLTTSKKNIQQSVGRIFRNVYKESEPETRIIYDIEDNNYFFNGQTSIRKNFYKSLNFDIKHIEYEIPSLLKIKSKK